MKKESHYNAVINLLSSSSDTKKLDLMLSLFVLSLLFLLPLLPASFGQGYEQIKVLLFFGLMTITSSLWIIASFKNPGRFRIKNTPLHLSFLGFLAALVVTSAFGINFSSSLLGNPPYYQGIIVYLYCYLLFLIITTIPIKVNAIYWGWIMGSVVVSVAALIQWITLHMLGITIPTYSGRVVSTFGQPSLYSGFLLFTLPVIFSLLKKTSSIQKKILVGILVINIFGIVVSESRGALLITAGLLFLWIWNAFKNKLVKVFLVIIIVSIGLLGLVSTFKGDGIINQEIIKPLTGTRVGEEGQERRVYIWLFAADLIQKKPLFGYGLDNLSSVFPTALNDQNPKPPFYFTVKDLTVDRAHNYLLDLLISGGIVTLGCWIIFYIILISQTRARWEHLFLLMFFVYLQTQILGIVQLVFFFTIAGLINRYHKNITPHKNIP